MLSLMASVLVAQVSTSDWVGWADMGRGPVNMSYLCGTSSNSAPETTCTIGSSIPASTSSESLFPLVSRAFLPSVRQCIDEQLNASNPIDCAKQVPVVGRFLSPSGTLEIVEDRQDGTFWVRLVDEEYGYGVFESRGDAQTWATEN